MNTVQKPQNPFVFLPQFTDAHTMTVIVGVFLSDTDFSGKNIPKSAFDDWAEFVKVLGGKYYNMALPITFDPAKAKSTDCMVDALTTIQFRTIPTKPALILGSVFRICDMGQGRDDDQILEAFLRKVKGFISGNIQPTKASVQIKPLPPKQGVKKPVQEKKQVEEEQIEEQEVEEEEQEVEEEEGDEEKEQDTGEEEEQEVDEEQDTGEEEEQEVDEEQDTGEEEEQEVDEGQNVEKQETKHKDGWRFTSLQHNGIVMAPLYEPLPESVKITYKGKKVTLTPEQEEYAFHFARYLETDHMKKPQFSTNFWKCWKDVLGKDHVVKDLQGCDFTPIHDHLMQQKEEKKLKTKEEKEQNKADKAKIKAKYGYAMVDGKQEAVGNFSMEPPGLFLGRGNHPKAGMWKKRIYPEDITLNLSRDAKIPSCPKGHKWGRIVYNHEVTWLATWKAPVLDTPKYVWLAATSTIRGESDQAKFDVARNLVQKIDLVRQTYNKELTSKDLMICQRATATWIIDKLALRVGNEKDASEAADTVGCCSLRVEHIKLHPPNKVEFDFLGKDSMRYNNTVEVDPLVYKNFVKFTTKPKKPTDDVFDCIDPTILNKYLSALMPGLTAKVFRTFNASYCMQQELDEWDGDEDNTQEEKLAFFNEANKRVAILCNHQRTVSKTFGASMQKMDEKIAENEEYLKDLNRWLKMLKKGSVPTKTNDKRPVPRTEDACVKKIAMIEGRIKKMTLQKQDKDNLKDIATSTSKINYIDPRITIAWCKKVDMDTSRVFAKTLRDKFVWAYQAVEEDEDFVF